MSKVKDPNNWTHGQDARKYLKERGWQEKRWNGDHLIMQDAQGHTATLPMAELPKGTRSGIIRQLKAVGAITILGLVAVSVDWYGLIMALSK